MSEKIVNIARNTSYYTLALVMQKVISFTYFVMIARALGPEDLGKYYFAISFTAIFAIFIDLGLTNVTTRETAKDQTQAEKLVSAALALKIPLAAISLGLVALLINLMHYPGLTRQLVYLSSICMILDSFTLTFFSIARGFHNLSFESIASVIFQLIVLSAGFVTLRLGFGARALIGGLVAASVFNFIYSAAILKNYWKVSIRPRLDRAMLRTVILFAIPFAIYGIFQRVYTYLDTVLLSALSGDHAVGIYQVPFKVIFAIQFLPAAFSASLYPAFSSYWANNREQLAVTFERAMNYLLIISLPLTIGILAIADKVILLFKSGYDDAILPLRITMLSLVFLFLNFAIGAILAACDRQKINTVNMGVVMATSVVLNLILIPRLGAVGASITVVATNFLLFVLGLSVVPKIIKIRPKKILAVFAKVGISAMIMGLSAYSLKSYLNVFLVVGISGLIYFAILFLLGGFRREDIYSIIKSFRKKDARSVIESGTEDGI